MYVHPIFRFSLGRLDIKVLTWRFRSRLTRIEIQLNRSTW